MLTLTQFSSAARRHRTGVFKGRQMKNDSHQEFKPRRLTIFGRI
jgi:hypothetical protein